MFGRREVRMCIECERSRIDRRAFLVGAAAVTATLAADAVYGQVPAKADPNPLDNPGIVHQPVTFKSGDASIRGYTARPKPAGKYPAVVLLEGNAGVTDQLRSTAAQVAQAGLFGLAVDWSSREPMPPRKEDQAKWLARVTSHTYWKLVLKDIGAAVGQLKGEASADATKLGLVGFCGGGKMALLFAAGSKDVKAVVAFYAAARYRSHAHKTDPVPDLIDVAKEIKIPVQGHYAGRDTVAPVADAREFEQALRAAKTVTDFHYYETAGHSFYDHTRPAGSDPGFDYCPAEAASARERMLSFLKKQLAS